MNNFDIASYDWNTWTVFFKEHWLVLVIALLVLFIVIRIVKTVVKWALAAVIIIGVVLYSGYTLDDVKEITGKVTEGLKQEAIDAMAGEMSEATFVNNADGTYTVKTKNLELSGVPGQNEVSVNFRGTPLGTWKIDETVRALIDTAKQNS
ncbi:hypothetical protein ACFO9Q_02035 [Paenibacillus sp. GCM10023252]|uniref:hypothetical protein n=1 Tax=Paenibacillus sp. GCM10023252 TaxID=3252649 RepID=UPI0036193A7B